MHTCGLAGVNCYSPPITSNGKVTRNTNTDEQKRRGNWQYTATKVSHCLSLITHRRRRCHHHHHRRGRHHHRHHLFFKKIWQT